MITRKLTTFGIVQNLQQHFRFTPFNNTGFTQIPFTNGTGTTVVRTKTSKSADPGYELNETGQAAAAQAQKGKIYDKKPFKFKCEQGKAYSWCACGWSHKQPFCDGTHRNKQLKITMTPVRFIAPETKEYSFCNCKQSSKRPFCDGTHKREDIQAAIKS